jgi:L-ascorbate metabolism protein UlaG (beta-lactamase superfamily)
MAGKADPSMNSNAQVGFRWLGANGMEFTCQGQTLVVDPFFTRPTLWQSLVSRPLPDESLGKAHLPLADHILITHAHHDHLMDVPAILRRTGANAYGSANSCALLRLLGSADGQVCQVSIGEHLSLGTFEVDVLPNQHVRTPIDHWITGQLRPNLKPPLRLVDYRMDVCFSYLIHAGGRRLLVGLAATKAEVFFVQAYPQVEQTASWLAGLNPKKVVLVHWDDFFRPLSRPLRPSLCLPTRKAPLKRLDILGYARHLRELLPGVKVLIPGLFSACDVFEP